MFLELSKEHNSFYIYDGSVIEKKIGEYKSSFPDVEILYSLKTNPNKRVRELIFSKGIGADAASINEVFYAVEAGVQKELIQFSAPGKTKDDLIKALDVATITADSLSEIKLINQIGIDNKKVYEIGVRINPNFTMTSDDCQPSKFGVDLDLFKENWPMLSTLSNVKIVGLHIHAKSQVLDTDLLKKYHENVLDLAKELKCSLPLDLKFINLGSGIGLPYSSQDSPCDIKELGNSTALLINNLKSSLADVKVYIESGRYLVGEAGTYVTKVLDKKQSMGKNMIILANTLNGFIRPSMNQLVSNYASGPNLPMTEPLFTSLDSFPPTVINQMPCEEREIVTLFGNLCTAIDVVAKDIELPKLEIGDLILYHQAGAYSAVVTPMEFSSQNKPVEIFLCEC